MILLQKVEKKYGSQIVLDIHQFELAKGIYWLKGVNGSGKSTLLKIISSLIPFNGKIILNGLDNNKNEVEYKNNISYSPADAALPPFLTGTEMLQFYSSIKKVSNKDLVETINLFELNNYAKNKIGTYSSGMQKKLSLALAFIGKPSLILLDEPLSTLDIDAAKLISTIIQKYHADGVSFIITSHQDFEYNSIEFSNQLLIKNSQLSIIK